MIVLIALLFSVITYKATQSDIVDICKTEKSAFCSKKVAASEKEDKEDAARDARQKELEKRYYP